VGGSGGVGSGRCRVPQGGCGVVEFCGSTTHNSTTILTTNRKNKPTISQITTNTQQNKTIQPTKETNKTQKQKKTKHKKQIKTNKKVMAAEGGGRGGPWVGAWWRVGGGRGVGGRVGGGGGGGRYTNKKM